MIDDKELIEMMKAEIQQKERQLEIVIEALNYALDNTTKVGVVLGINRIVSKLDVEMQLKELLGGIKQ